MLDKQQETYQLIKDNLAIIYFLEEVFFVDCALIFKIFIKNFNLSKGTELVAQDYYNKQKNSYVKDFFKKSKITENVYNEDLIFFELHNQNKELIKTLTPKKQRIFKLMNFLFSQENLSEEENNKFKSLKEKSYAFKTFNELSEKLHRELIISQLVLPYQQTVRTIVKDIKQNYEIDYPIGCENPNENVFQYNQRLSVVSTCRAFGSLERQKHYQEYEAIINIDMKNKKNNLVLLMNELLKNILTPTFLSLSNDECRVKIEGILLNIPEARKTKDLKI